VRRTRTAALYLLLTVAWSWPLAIHLSDRVVHDTGDPLFITYVMWWNAHTVPFTSAWWNAPFFWPMRGALGLSDHLAGLWPLSTPLQALGASPLIAYNLVFICATWFTLLASHALVRRLTGSGVAAACGAVAFAFAPYRTSEMGHLQLYACWWIPLCLLAALRYLQDGNPKWLGAFAASWLLQALTNGYYLLFLPPLLAAWTLWMNPWRTHPRRVFYVAIAWAAASLLLAPILIVYYREHRLLGLARSRPEMAMFSATWRALFAAKPNLLFWHTSAPATTEAYLFPGVTTVALLIGAAAARIRDRVLWFFVAAAAVAFWLCMGPVATGPSLASLWHPYDWLVWLPGFNGLRVPARFFMVTAMSLAIAAAIAFARLRALVRYPGVLTAAVFAGLFVDGAIRGMPLLLPPERLAMVERGARIVALPFDSYDVAIPLMYQSMPLRLRVVNGYAGYFPPHADVIRWALARHDASVLTELRRGQPLYVLVADTPDADRWTAFVDALREAELAGVQGGGRMYKMTAAPAAAPWSPSGSLPIAGGRSSPGWLVLDLGAVHVVTAVELRTWGSLLQLPASMQIQTSQDAATWRTVFDERPGGAALVGALADPRAIPIRMSLRGTAARYVRMNAPFFRPGAVTIYGS
jgi:F5/8 type C domain-containing protein